MSESYSKKEEKNVAKVAVLPHSRVAVMLRVRCVGFLATGMYARHRIRAGAKRS